MRKKTSSIDRVLIQGTEAGDSDAHFKLAEAYRIGRQVPRDYKQAIRWYRRAGKQGHVGAQNDLGSMLLNGMGTAAPDPQEAAQWFLRAAEARNRTAQFNLALRYLHGTGLPQNDEQAVF